MLPALRPRLRPRRPIAHLCRYLSSSSSGEGCPPTARTDPVAAAKAQEAMTARMEAYKKVQEFDWSSGADWKTAANILFTVPPKRKEFGLGFHLVQLFFVCMPSLAVYLVAQYARREIKRMEAGGFGAAEIGVAPAIDPSSCIDEVDLRPWRLWLRAIGARMGEMERKGTTAWDDDIGEYPIERRRTVHRNFSHVAPSRPSSSTCCVCCAVVAVDLLLVGSVITSRSAQHRPPDPVYSCSWLMQA